MLELDCFVLDEDSTTFLLELNGVSFDEELFGCSRDDDRDVILTLLEDVILTPLLDFAVELDDDLATLLEDVFSSLLLIFTVELDEYFFIDDEDFVDGPDASSFRQRTEYNPA